MFMVCIFLSFISLSYILQDNYGVLTFTTIPHSIVDTYIKKYYEHEISRKLHIIKIKFIYQLITVKTRSSQQEFIRYSTLKILNYIIDDNFTKIFGDKYEIDLEKIYKSIIKNRYVNFTKNSNLFLQICRDIKRCFLDIPSNQPRNAKIHRRLARYTIIKSQREIGMPLLYNGKITLMPDLNDIKFMKILDKLMADNLRTFEISIDDFYENDKFITNLRLIIFNISRNCSLKNFRLIIDLNMSLLLINFMTIELEGAKKTVDIDDCIMNLRHKIQLLQNRIRNIDIDKIEKLEEAFARNQNIYIALNKDYFPFMRIYHEVLIFKIKSTHKVLEIKEFDMNRLSQEIKTLNRLTNRYLLKVLEGMANFMVIKKPKQ